MPGSAHEILVMALRERPALLGLLWERVGEHVGVRAVTEPLGVVDSTVRFADVKEVRPDVLYTSNEVPWLVLEVQHEVDEAKRRRWPLLASVLLDEHKQMGELVVLTASRRVAHWAGASIQWTGPRGTRLAMWPLVLWISPALVDDLLTEEAPPELALVAAWALRTQSGPRARARMERVIRRTGCLSEPLRSEQARAILHVINDQLLEHVRAMDLRHIPESEPFQRFKRVLQAEGKRDALLQYLDARGVTLTPAQRTQVESCTDPERLARWLAAAFRAHDPLAIEATLFDEGP